MHKGVPPRMGAWMLASCLTIAAFGLTVLMLTTTTAAESSPLPIPQQRHAQPVPPFIGHPTIPVPISTSPIPPHPFMAPNGRSNIHLDAYMSGTYEMVGLLGRSPEVRSTLLFAECGTVTFDRAGRIITVCLGSEARRLLLLDPVTLAIEAVFRLPPIQSGLGFETGIYCFLDQLDRTMIPTDTRQIWVVAEVEGPHGPRFELVRLYDLSLVVPEEDTIVSALPDLQGLLWFVTAGGLVGTVEPDTGQSQVLPLGETISNSFAVDPVAERGGLFIVSDYAMYRFDAGPDGAPGITWREPYDRGTRLKPGQVQVGSGTTPTLLGTQFVTITDNADPQMHVLVYRRAPAVEGSRLVCAVPVFQPGMSATENALIGTDRSIVVENNYGYTGSEATMFGRTTEPGITRIDLDDDEGGCHTVWTSQERVPSVVSQMSLATGLVYTYTKDPGPGATDAWYFTAIDFRTSETVFKRLAGTGVLYNNDYSGLYLWPDGTAYVGILGGLVAIRDSE